MNETEYYLHQIENKARSFSNDSSMEMWEIFEYERSDRAASELLNQDIPWLLDRLRKNEAEREEAVKALEWALAKIAAADPQYAEDREGQWACRVLAALKERPV